jgi:hypothetical protein
MLKKIGTKKNLSHGLYNTFWVFTGLAHSSGPIGFFLFS